MELEDDDPDVFGMFSYWTIYQDLDANEVPTSTLMLSKLWILADKLRCPKLQNAVIYELNRKWRDLFVLMCKDLIFKNTSTDSQLYKFLIDNMAELWEEEGKIEQWEGLSSENFFDLLKKIRFYKKNGTVLASIDKYYVYEKNYERR